jgi:hypothetical protein
MVIPAAKPQSFASASVGHARKYSVELGPAVMIDARIVWGSTSGKCRVMTESARIGVASNEMAAATAVVTVSLAMVGADIRGYVDNSLY